MEDVIQVEMSPSGQIESTDRNFIMDMDDASILKYLDELIYQRAVRDQKGLAAPDPASADATFDFVKGLLLSKNDKVRTNAAIALVYLDPDRAQHFFLSLIPRANADLRSGLLDTIGVTAYPRDRNPIMGDEKLRENIDLFIKLLTDDSAEVRSAAAYILGNMESSRAVEPLIEVLNDDDNQVRYSAAQSLGWLGDIRALEPLIGTLSSEPRGYFGIVVAALGELGRVEAVPALVALLNRDLDWFTLTETVEVLEQMGGRRTILALVAESVISSAYDKCLPIVQTYKTAKTDNEHNYESMRGNAAKALGMLGGDKAVAELIKCLHDKSLLVQRQAISGLAHTESTQAEEELKKLVHGNNAILSRDANEELKKRFKN